MQYKTLQYLLSTQRKAIIKDKEEMRNISNIWYNSLDHLNNLSTQRILITSKFFSLNKEKKNDAYYNKSVIF